MLAHAHHPITPLQKDPLPAHQVILHLHLHLAVQVHLVAFLALCPHHHQKVIHHHLLSVAVVIPVNLLPRVLQVLLHILPAVLQVKFHLAQAQQVLHHLFQVVVAPHGPLPHQL